MSRLLVQVSVTERDFVLFEDALFVSLNRFFDLVENNVRIYFVYQTESKCVPINVFFKDTRVVLDVMPCVGVSVARNKGIEFANANGFDYIFFHDSSIFVSHAFIRFLKLALSRRLEICKGIVSWNVDFEEQLEKEVFFESRDVNILYECYVWSYVFNLRFIGNLRFNELVGPGESTALKAGEDFQFLFNLFGDRFIFSIPVGLGALVSHPPRTRDNLKRLKYAEAQGVLLRWLLIKGGVSFSLLFYIFLFFGNSLSQIIFFRKNSFSILAVRVKGFIDFYKRRKFFGD